MTANDEAKLHLTFLRKTYDDEEAAKKNADIDQAWIGGKVLIGKENKKEPNDLDLTGSYLSRKHVTFTPGHVTDHSSNGTYLHPRTSDNEKQGVQSVPVQFNPADQHIYIFGY